MKVIYPGIIKRIKRMLTGNYVEDGNTASQNIAAGKYVTWKNQLCKSTTAITTGDTLSSSNLEAVVDGGLNAVDSNLSQKISNLSQEINKIVYVDTHTDNNTYYIPLSKLQNYHDYGCALVAAWRTLFLLFYHNANDMSITKIATCEDTPPSATVSLSSGNVKIVFSSTRWHGITVLPL